MSHRILLTGASGFVGKAVLGKLLERGEAVVVALRHGSEVQGKGAEQFRFAQLDGGTEWKAALGRVDTVIHSAARVHVMNDTDRDPLATFRRVNVEGTLNLARQAAKAGVKRFIFISSIKVNGEGTPKGRPYTADDQPAPSDPYGISKREAEDALRSLALESGMEVVIIRPVLVYGPGVKANFLSMMRWLEKGVPLPLGAIDNRRSLVALDNLADLIATCVDHPNAANQTFLVSDGEDLSTSALLRRMAFALGRPARLIPVPAGLLKFGCSILGKRSLSQRLCGSLQVDIEKNRSLLGWTPPVSVDEALRLTARNYQGRA
ncbi:SDR family oxidoreductase [Pseudomonas mosselii]|uniref:UDP-glucose 4-epimerase family protein n=1 Tax=Pseudomonas mosselii TaxID=78327 RepID=UPI002447926B|nr:SDR family oxidoreductase [Pseudomonas mosselii]MDH1657960.1 SDR family oxidoreductase [Pseudomonas mosselii]MDH1714896.1 SDR family oxidoreductase [Pseudomonas mosselii]MDH1721641.1 SDR family oxidoreductase [Pseudomonas mosselii]